MRRFAMAVSAALLLGVAGAAQANSVWIDYTGPRVVSQGLTQVNTSRSGDALTQIVRRGDRNTARTGGTDAVQFAYYKISPAFKANLQSVWVTVEYYDDGLGGFRLQYDGQSSATDVSGPGVRYKYDTGYFLTQTWHLTGFKLQGGQDGGADFRINDRATDSTVDGPEYIASVTVSDVDPYFTYFPYATTKPTVDGKVAAGEWDEAGFMTLDAPWYDAISASKFVSAADYSATIGLKYDETNVYVLGMITDATPRLNSTSDGANYWQGDGVELFIGLDDLDPERTTMSATDFHVFLGMGQTPGWSVASTGSIATLDPVGSNVVVTDVPGGYVFEAAIPWAKLDPTLKVAQGQRFAWYLFANNSTVTPSSQQIALGPTGITGPSGNPSRWIRGVLDLAP
jgi:Carbohydrate family 9 binding domain-like